MDPALLHATQRIRAARRELADLRCGLLLLHEFDAAVAVERVDARLVEALTRVEVAQSRAPRSRSAPAVRCSGCGAGLREASASGLCGFCAEERELAAA